jgi:hypothetical protein
MLIVSTLFTAFAVSWAAIAIFNRG